MKSRTFRPGWAILVAVLLFLGLKAFVLDVAVVDGRSMKPVLESGSLVLVLRFAYGIRRPWGSGYLLCWGAPRRGDIVAAASPRDGLAVVKRVAAAGPLKLSVAAGHLVGPGLDAPLSEDQAMQLADGVVLRADAFYLLGDNPPESIDSRDYGAVPIEAISGRVLIFDSRAPGHE